MHIVLPREYPLAFKDVIKLTNLRDERWIIYQQRTHPLLYERIMRRVHEESIHPKRVDRILYSDEAEQLSACEPWGCLPHKGECAQAKRRSACR